MVDAEEEWFRALFGWPKVENPDDRTRIFPLLAKFLGTFVLIIRHPGSLQDPSIILHSISATISLI
jgi:hypothetical protein